MLRRLSLCLVAILAVSSSMPAFAADDADHAKRVELATEMNKIRPGRVQVQEAINQIRDSMPPADRDRFMKMIDKAFDYDKLEKLSIDTMANLYTTAELQKMVDYFGSPEAKSAEKKFPEYEKVLQPEIIKQLDKAMMADKTGGPSDVSVSAPSSTPPQINPNPAKPAPAPSPATTTPVTPPAAPASTPAKKQ